MSELIEEKNGTKYYLDVQKRTVVCVMETEFGIIKGKSHACPDDEFNLTAGKEKARARVLAKIKRIEMQGLVQELEEANAVVVEIARDIKKTESRINELEEEIYKDSPEVKNLVPKSLSTRHRRIVEFTLKEEEERIASARALKELNKEKTEKAKAAKEFADKLNKGIGEPEERHHITGGLLPEKKHDEGLMKACADKAYAAEAAANSIKAKKAEKPSDKKDSDDTKKPKKRLVALKPKK